MNQYILLHDWYESVRTRMSKYVLVHTSIFRKFWFSLIPPCPLLDTRRYKAVQGSTRKSRTPGYGGTRRYMKVRGLVPPRTSISRGTGLSGTASYRLVPPRIQKRTGRYERNQNLRNMLVCTSTYLYILVHTDSYQLCKSRPIHTLVLVCTSTYQYR